jgi:hypothetical protein
VLATTINHVAEPLLCRYQTFFPAVFLLFFIAIKKEMDEEGESSIIRKPWTATEQLRKLLRY